MKPWADGDAQFLAEVQPGSDADHIGLSVGPSIVHLADPSSITLRSAVSRWHRYRCTFVASSLARKRARRILAVAEHADGHITHYKQ